jgi:hypothetical protein
MIEVTKFLIGECDTGRIRRITIVYRNDEMISWALD